MIKWCCIIISILFSNQLFALTVMPEIATPIDLSDHDINRLVCNNGAIGDVYYSKEKAVTVTVDNQNAYVKFLVKRKGDNEQFVKSGSELFVVCASDVYSLIITPKSIPSQTIHLSDPHKNQMTENIALYKEQPLEKQIVDLTLRVIKNQMPESFEVTSEAAPLQWHEDWLQGMNIAKYQIIRVPGVGLKLSEYLIKSNDRQAIAEKRFLSTLFGSNIIGVTIVGRRLQPGVVAHVYIVERAVA